MLNPSKNPGRGVIMTSKFIETETHNLNLSKKINLKKTKDFFLKFVFNNMNFLFFYPTIKQINKLYWYFNKFDQYFSNNLIDFKDYYFFHKNFNNFYNVYKENGFLSFQIIFSEDSVLSIKRLIKFLTQNNIYSTLSGIKKMCSDDFLISFQGDGLSISIDLPITKLNKKDIKKNSDFIYNKVLDLGGKINLTKDSFLTNKIFKKMYKNYDKFWEIKEKIDPSLTFSNQKAKELFNF